MSNPTDDLGRPVPGIGIDVVDLDSFTESCSREGFIEKVFCKSEIAYCQAKKDPFPSFAGRFAVKEAFYKALGDPDLKAVPWRGIETISEHGQLRVQLSEKLQKKMKGRKIYLSLTHSNYVAAAVVLLLTE
ncbi:4'-phosphopantetheinyl transferase [candidate division LCP-89 bacterium B3_LCP]|uniref:Holo-[acyl-carrier-protein] synthase n=1 Tax=candidate division LCP-89 bacterium B3_LCP TaxID=2012998 RepID=A0A532V379_UNCL8|nr:MAG: 4'-phosphopantetheinyl transferase [candidate division LCP-89 bacterium B3_LCP]